MCYHIPKPVSWAFRSRCWDYQSGYSVIPFCLAARQVYHVSPRLAKAKSHRARSTQVAFRLSSLCKSRAENTTPEPWCSVEPMSQSYHVLSVPATLLTCLSAYTRKIPRTQRASGGFCIGQVSNLLLGQVINSFGTCKKPLVRLTQAASSLSALCEACAANTTPDKGAHDFSSGRGARQRCHHLATVTVTCTRSGRSPPVSLRSAHC